MRVVAIPLALVLALAAPVAGRAASSGPVRLYLHSATGAYLDDWNADPAAGPQDRAPSGSTLSRTVPGRRTDATARHAGPNRTRAGDPGAPTFTLPYTGPLWTICVDVWAQAKQRPIPAAQDLTLYVALETKNGPVVSGALRQDAYDGSLVRLTGAVTFPPHTSVPDGSSLVLAPADAVANPDWVIAYDSITHPSSLTLNPKTCGSPKPAPARIAYPKSGCTTFTDQRGDATLTTGGADKAEPSLDVTGVVVGSTPSDVVAFVRVADLATRPQYAPGYTWSLAFRVNGDAVEAIRTAYDPDTLGAAPDAAAAYGADVPQRTRLLVNGKYVPSSLAVTFDTDADLVLFRIPLGDLLPRIGGITAGRAFTQIGVRSAEAYPPGGTTADAEADSTPTAMWRFGDNRCF